MFWGAATPRGWLTPPPSATFLQLSKLTQQEGEEPGEELSLQLTSAPDMQFYYNSGIPQRPRRARDGRATSSVNRFPAASTMRHARQRASLAVAGRPPAGAAPST